MAHIKTSITLLASAMMLSVSQSAQASVNWTEGFDVPDTFGAFTVLDVNRDGVKWEHNDYNKCARISYNDDLAMDDWLITPAFTLEAGISYKFALDAKNYMGAEKFEVFVGNAPKAEDMTIPVIALQSVTKMKYESFEGQFTVPESGRWYVGIHGCSDAGKLYLDIDNLMLTEGVDPHSPKAVSEFTLTADENGADAVTITCTLPDEDVSGNDIISIDKVEVLCDGNSVASKMGTPGALFTWTHDDATAGQHKYTVVVYAGGKRGEEVSGDVFVGPNIPSEIPYLGVGEFTDGDVTLRWRCPDTDIDGKKINPSMVSYKVVYYEVMEGSLYYEEDIEGADNLTETEFIHHAIDAGVGQKFTAYGVYAKTAAGKSRVSKTPLFPVGTGYVAPWKESFANGESEWVFRSETVKYTSVSPWWTGCADADSDVKSFDGDGGYLSMMGEQNGDCARYYSGKIDLSQLSAPALSFYVYNYSNGFNSSDENEFEVYVSDGRTFQFQKDFKVSDLGAPGWNLVTVPLDAFKGQTIQFALQVTVGNYMMTPVDCIRVGEYSPTDLAAVSLSAPASVNGGTPFTISARIENRGSQTADDYSVTLYRDGTLVQTMQGPSIAPDGTAEISFTENISVFATGKALYHVEVKANGDADASNDATPDVEVPVEAPLHPAPLSLTGATEGNAVALSWTAPDLSVVSPEVITDDFESYPSFATGSAGEWTFVDVDGAPIGKLGEITFPGITVEYQPASFWVNDATFEQLNQLFAANSGSKYLAQMFNADGSKCDDWAISPELFGNAQTITFYAKGYSRYATEEMEVLYSLTGKNIADFKFVKKIGDVPNAWTKYEAELPEGTKYFALRCTSTDCYMLFIDDVTFVPSAGKTALTLLGYNVYRDETRLNAEPVTSLAYTDTEVPNGNHTYEVTAIYDKGESKPSASFVTMVSGLETVLQNADAAVAYGLKGEIAVKGATGHVVSVYSLDGKCLNSSVMDSSGSISAAPGIYIVAIGDKRFKVTVR